MYSRGELGYRWSCLLEDGDRGLVGSVKKQLASPVEQVVFGGIDVCGGLKVVGGRDKFAVLLVDLAEQVVQFAGIFVFQHGSAPLPCLGKPPEEKVCHRQVVAIIVRSR